MYQNVDCQFISIANVVIFETNGVRFIGNEGLKKLVKIRNDFVARINLTFSILDGMTHPNYHGNIQLVYIKELDSIITEFDNKLNAIMVRK